MDPQKRKAVILLAEDDEDDYLLAKDVFQDSETPHDLRWVKDGEELMDYLSRRGRYQKPEDSPRPTLVLLDLNMPRKDGREALKEMKSHTEFRRIPVIILTTSKAEEDIFKTYDLGANSFIRKPVGFDQYVNVVKVFQKYWFEIVQLPV